MSKRMKYLSLVALIALLVPVKLRINAEERPFLSTVHDLDTLTSTVPANGDVNPYGVAIVPVTTGALVAGNVLVSNFNNSANLQGTGTRCCGLRTRNKWSMGYDCS